MNVHVPSELLHGADVSELSRQRLLRPGLVMVFAIEQALGIKYHEALALAQYIAVKSKGQLDLLVYHLLEDDSHANYVMRVPYEQGLPALGWTCEMCERVVRNPNRVAYDVALILTVEVTVVANG